MPFLDPQTYLLAAGSAFLIALVSATGGVTGAFLLVPFQISVLGLGGPSVSATNHLYNVVAAPGGFGGYWRQGRLFRPLALVLVAGSVPGIAFGVAVRLRYLPDPTRFRSFAGGVLIVLGLALLARSIARHRRGDVADGRTGEIVVDRFDWRRLRFRFNGRSYGIAVPGAFLYAVAIGAIGGAYGVGGGVFTSAYLVGVCGLPVYATAGATMLSTFVASCAGAIGFALVHRIGAADAAVAPMWTLGLAMGLGGLAGGYLGARMQRFLLSVLICVVLSLIMLLLGTHYLVGAGG
jgi:uncharacterized membrane protein YfcA